MGWSPPTGGGGSGAVSSVAANDASVTVSPTTGNVKVSATPAITTAEAFTTANAVATPSGQSFVSGASPANTRRSTLVLAEGGNNPTTTTQDCCSRTSFTLPVGVTRARFRIRNAGPNGNLVSTSPVAVTGIWWGTPNTAAEGTWLGDFTAAPTQVYAGAAAADIGTTELVTPWFAPPASAVANALQGVSFGFTSASDSAMYVDSIPGYTWHGTTGAGYAANAGGAGVPSGTGTASPYWQMMDIRMEFEFVGSNPIGFYIGSSLTIGYCATFPGIAFGKMGADNEWPQMAANRRGHLAVNGGLNGATCANFLSASTQPWTRFNDPTTGTLFGACLPDYAVIDLGINDSATPSTLATYQSNIETIIANLQAAGITKIFICTTIPGFLTETGVGYGGHYTTFQMGQLKAALAAGSASSLTVTGPVTPTTAQPGPGGGFPGPPATWYDASNTGTPGLIFLEYPASGISEGPITLTAASGTATLTLSFSGGFTFANAHAAGAPVFATREGYRQLYNHWIRTGVPGTMATIDMAKATETPALAVAGGNLLAPSQKNWSLWGAVDNVHPYSPAVYQAMAQEADTLLVGI